MPFPPQFNDLGKKAKDLLSKNYDCKNSIKTINKAKEGVTLESGATRGKDIDGYIRGVYKCSDFGEAEGEIHSGGAPKDTKAKVKFDKFCKNAAVTISASSVPDCNVDANYKQANFAGNVSLANSDTSCKANGAISFGMDGLSAGVHTCIDLTGGNFTIKDYNAAAEFNHSDIQAAIRTSNGRKDVTLSLHQKLESDLFWGASLVLHPADLNSRLLTIGTQYQCDKHLLIKGRANSDGVVGLSAEHKLHSPPMKFGVSAEFDAESDAAKKFGISMVFGD